MSVETGAPALDREHTEDSTDRDASSGSDAFAVKQRSLTGGKPSGQVTLTGELVVESPVSDDESEGNANPHSGPDLSRPSNSGRGECTRALDAVEGVPDHIKPCTCSNHDGWCEECGFKITVTPSGREAGHARASNRTPESSGPRKDCSHRDPACNPRREQ